MEKMREGLLRNFLQLLGLCGFAIAQPLYDIGSQNAEFFVAHNTKPLDLIFIVLSLSLLVPIFLILVEFGLNQFGKRIREFFHYVFIGSFVLLLLLPPLKKVLPLHGIFIVGVALVIGLAFAWGCRKSKFLRNLVTLSAAGAVVFPVIFLFFSPVEKILFKQTADFHTDIEIKNPVPIVLIVLDEFNPTAIMDENQMIDDVRFPNFAAFAKDAYWFRKATAVDNSTTYAVPGILTGKYSDGSPRLAVPGDYPDNLFTMLSGTYDMNISETLTDLWPKSILNIKDGSEWSFLKLGFMIGDIGIIYLHIILPDDFKNNLPSLSHGWKGFFHELAIEKRKKSAWKRNTRVDQVNEFIEGIKRSSEPSFHFLHVLLPHHHYDYTPRGKFYSPVAVLDGLVINKGLRNQWIDEEPLVNLAQQRYLLQVGFTDMLLGRILDQLKSKGIYDRSLIIVTADHGVCFRSGQPQRPINDVNYPDLMAIPMFLKLPEQQESKIRDDFVETIDIMPTIAEVLDVDLPWETDGHSMISSSFSDRIRKTVYQHGKDPRTYETELVTSFPLLDKQINLFGSRTPLDRLVVRGKYDELLGKNIEDMHVETVEKMKLEIDQLDKFQKPIDLESDFIPLYLSGRIIERGPYDLPIYLAFSINGSIVLVTRTVSSLGTIPEFRVVLPESAIRQGDNHIEILIIDDYNGRSLKLIRAGSVSTRNIDDDELGKLLMTATDKGRAFKAPSKIRFPGDLLDNATFATIEWPDKPEWSYIEVIGKHLRLNAPMVGGNQDRTIIITPIDIGRHRITSDIKLRDEAAFPVILSLEVQLADGTVIGFFEKEFKPGESFALDQHLEVKPSKDGDKKSDKVKLIISCRMQEGATNNWNAALVMRNLKLTTWK